MMVVIKIDRRSFAAFVCVVFVVIAIVAFLNIMPDEKMSTDTFMTSLDTIGDSSENIEIFDITEGSVILKYKPNPVFQKEASHYLETITGMYSKLKVFPDSGYIMKISLNPPAQASGKWLTASGLTNIDKVYVIFPLQSEPYLLILDEQSRPLCFHFNADTSTLKEYLKK